MMGKEKTKFNLSEFYSKFGIILILLFMVIIFSLVNSKFISANNIRNVIRQVVVITILACGEQLMLISGMVDLSAGTVMAFGGTLSAYCVSATQNVPLAILVGLAGGLFFGVINGALITIFSIPAFIGTLASMKMASGAIMWYTNGKNKSNLGDAYTWLGQGYIGPIPVPVIIMVIALLITYYVLAWTPVGRNIYAVGGNLQAAKATGIRVRNTQFFACVFSGLCAGLAGIVLMARLNSGQPSTGQAGMEMDAITAVIVGGTSMSGGVGAIQNTIIGSLIIGIIKNFMNLQNIHSSIQDIVLGILICVAVIIDVQVRRSKV